MQLLTHLSERLYLLGTSRSPYQTQSSLSLLQDQLPEFSLYLLDFHTSFSQIPTWHFPLSCCSTFACTLTPRPHLHACLPLCIPPGPYISLTQFAVLFLNAFSLPTAPTVSGMSIFLCPLLGPHRVADRPLASLMPLCLLLDCK